MAEGLFRAGLEDAQKGGGWLVDSAGTYAGDGRAPEPAAVTVAARYGADISDLRSRSFELADFERFDNIVAMDHGHLDLLMAIRPEGFNGTISMLPSERGAGFIEVPDPYGGETRGYEKAGKLIVEGTVALLARLRS